MDAKTSIKTQIVIVIEKHTKTHIITGIKKFIDINTNIRTNIKASLDIEDISLGKDIIETTLEGMTVAVVGPKQLQI